jgi:hypothetical protein
MPQPLKDAFLRVNPDQQKLRTMHDKDAARMQTFRDVPDDTVRSVRASTLIVLGDQGHRHARARFGADLPDSGIAIADSPCLPWRLSGRSRHDAYPELTARLIEGFLDASL